MRVISVLALTFLFVASVSSRNIRFTECGAQGTVQTVDVEPCKKEPCEFKKGQQVTIQASIVPKEKFENGKLNVVIDMEGIEVEYPGIETDLCKKIPCPIEKGKEVKATYKITAEDFFPDMLTDMKWEAKDANEKVIFCVVAKVGIQS